MVTSSSGCAWNTFRREPQQPRLALLGFNIVVHRLAHLFDVIRNIFSTLVIGEIRMASLGRRLRIWSCLRKKSRHGFNQLLVAQGNHLSIARLKSWLPCLRLLSDSTKIFTHWWRNPCLRFRAYIVGFVQPPFSILDLFLYFVLFDFFFLRLGITRLRFSNL